MAESYGTGSRRRFLVRIVAAASGAVALAAPGMVALADETVPSGGTATTAAPQDPAAGAALGLGLSVAGAQPAPTDATGPATGGGGAGQAGIAGRLTIAGVNLAVGLGVAAPCGLVQGDCGSPPSPRPSPASLPSPAPEAGSLAEPSPQPAPEGAGRPPAPVGGPGSCTVLADVGCSPGRGQGSVSSSATALGGAGCPVECLVGLALGEPLGAAGIDRAETIQPVEGAAAPTPIPGRLGTTSKPSQSNPSLASTGSPLGAGLAGLLMVVLGTLLTWRRMRR